METEDKNKNHKKRLVLIIILIAAAAAACLLFIFKPWEISSTPADGETIITEEAAAANAALEDPESHVGEEVSFIAEAATDSQNIEGMFVFNGVVDNQYFVSVSYLDREQALNFNTGDKVNVTGTITGSTLVSIGDEQFLSGADIAAQSVESVY